MAAAVESEQVLSREYVVHAGKRVFPSEERDTRCVICNVEVTEGDFAIESVLRKCRTRESRARVACYECSIDYAKRYQQKRVESSMVLSLSDAWAAHSMKSGKGEKTANRAGPQSEKHGSAQRRITDNGSLPCSGDIDGPSLDSAECKNNAAQAEADSQVGGDTSSTVRNANRCATDASLAQPPGIATPTARSASNTPDESAAIANDRQAAAEKNRARASLLDISTIDNGGGNTRADDENTLNPGSETRGDASRQQPPTSDDASTLPLPRDFHPYNEALLGVAPLPAGASMRHHSRAPAASHGYPRPPWDSNYPDEMPLPGLRPFDPHSRGMPPPLGHAGYPTSHGPQQRVRTPESNARFYQQARTNAYAHARFVANGGALSPNLSSLPPGVISPIYPTRGIEDLPPLPCGGDGVPRPSVRQLHNSYPMSSISAIGGGPRVGSAQPPTPGSSGDYGGYGGSAATDDQSSLGFLVVTQLVKTGAADQAGLHVGDIFIKFGSVSKQNFPGLKSLAELVRQSAGGAIPSVVLRRMEACVNDNGQPMVFDAPVLQKIHLTLRPLQSQDVRGGGVLGAVINTWPLPEPVKYH